jgi:hypothetical protein
MKAKLPELPAKFVDPITGYPPTGEVQMSGLLGLLHQLGRIDWSMVPLLTPDNNVTNDRADDLFAQSVICSEYQLFCSSRTEMSTWGAMPADLICLSRDEQKVILLENKIGSGFTGVQNDPARAVGKAARFSVPVPDPEGFLGRAQHGRTVRQRMVSERIAKNTAIWR